MKKLNKNQMSGITLIALVVTIIVLLILAGISIQMLSGDNGILTRAGDAKTMTDEAQIREKIQLAYHSALTGGKGSYTKENLEPIAIGGATYARAFKNCVSFGANMPGKKDMCHQSDEFISIDNLILASKIYAKAIYELAK